MSFNNSAPINSCPQAIDPYFNSGHNMPEYPQYLSPYVIDLIKEYDNYEQNKIIPYLPIHRRLTYKEFLTYQRYLRERHNNNKMV